MNEKESLRRQLENNGGEERPRKRRRVSPRRARRALMIRAVVAVVGILLLLGILSLILKGRAKKAQDKTFTEYEVLWEKEELGSSDATFVPFAGGVLKMTLDGIACIDADGSTLWNYGYSMRNPKVIVKADYGAVMDIQSNSAVLFDATGTTHKVTTNLPIVGGTISAHGVVALVQDEIGADYVTFYDNNGESLDIRIKTKLSGDGYPLDISLSPVGTGLVASVVYLDQNSMQNQIVFYNFDVDQKDSGRMVGLYNYGDTMFPEVAYLSDTVAAAFGDDQVNLYSLRRESKPSLIESLPMTGEIYSVLYDEKQVGIICQSEKANRMLYVFGTDGKLKYEHILTFDYDSAEFSGGNIVISNSMECLILNERGVTRYQGTLDASIRKVICIDDRNCLVMSGASMKKIRFR